MSSGPVRTVLVVDDNARMRELARLFLEGQDHEIWGEAASAAEALAMLAGEDRPDVIVLDHHMPERTGLDALPDIRRSCPTAWIVLWASAPDIAFEARLAGADAFLDKASSLEALVASVAGAL